MTIDLALIFPLNPFAVVNMITPFTDYHIIASNMVKFIKDKDFLRLFLFFEKIACSNSDVSQRAFFLIFRCRLRETVRRVAGFAQTQRFKELVHY